jgi:hypothetical protein
MSKRIVRWVGRCRCRSLVRRNALRPAAAAELAVPRTVLCIRPSADRRRPGRAVAGPMSDRYEWYLGTPPISVRDPDDELWCNAEDGNDEGHWALVVGDPAGTALVIYGDPADLRAAAVAALPTSGDIIDGDVVTATLALPWRRNDRPGHDTTASG